MLQCLQKTFNDPKIRRSTAVLYKEKYCSTGTGTKKVSQYFCTQYCPPLPILSIYFQWSFDLGIFPQAFKTAKVIPIFKSGSKEILGNY